MDYKGKSAEYYAGLDKRSKEYREYKEYLATSSDDDLGQKKAKEQALKDIGQDLDNNVVFTIEGEETELTVPEASSGESSGLGDTVEKVLDKVGIKSLVKWLNNGKDCGCDKRRDKLNSLVGYPAKCLVESEYIWLKGFQDRYNPNRFEAVDVYMLSKIHTRVFNRTQKICSSCNGAAAILQGMVSRLDKVVAIYDEDMQKD